MPAAYLDSEKAIAVLVGCAPTATGSYANDPALLYDVDGGGATFIPSLSPVSQGLGG